MLLLSQIYYNFLLQNLTTEVQGFGFFISYKYFFNLIFNLVIPEFIL